MTIATPIEKPKIMFEDDLNYIIHQDHEEGREIVTYTWSIRPPGVRLIIPYEEGLLLTLEHRNELRGNDTRLAGGKISKQQWRQAGGLHNEMYDFRQEYAEQVQDLAIHTGTNECSEEVGFFPKGLIPFSTSRNGANQVWDLHYLIISGYEKGMKLAPSPEKGETILARMEIPHEQVHELIKGNTIDGEPYGIKEKLTMKEDRSKAKLAEYYERQTLSETMIV